VGWGKVGLVCHWGNDPMKWVIDWIKNTSSRNNTPSQIITSTLILSPLRCLKRMINSKCKFRPSRARSLLFDENITFEAAFLLKSSLKSFRNKQLLQIEPGKFCANPQIDQHDAKVRIQLHPPWEGQRLLDLVWNFTVASYQRQRRYW